jgi:hypothetical protein
VWRVTFLLLTKPANKLPDLRAETASNHGILVQVIGAGLTHDMKQRPLHEFVLSSVQSGALWRVMFLPRTKPICKFKVIIISTTASRRVFLTLFLD